MGIDTMKPSSKVWCILYPLPGNAVGKTTLFLTKFTTAVGSETSNDIILRHHKISDQHCAIVPGAWDKEHGLTGLVYGQDLAPMKFRHGSRILILDEQNGMLLFSRDAHMSRTYRIYCRVPRLRHELLQHHNIESTIQLGHNVHQATG